MKCEDCKLEHCYRLTEIPFDTDPCGNCIYNLNSHEICKSCSKDECSFVMRPKKIKSAEEKLEETVIILRSIQEFCDNSEEGQAIEQAIKALENQQILENALEKMAITALSSQGMVISQKSIKEICDASKQRAAYLINGIGGCHHE